ncbi:MAG: porin, partial [Succinivibrio sp.]|nr:porin [Succinivibrio sp.]
MKKSLLALVIAACASQSVMAATVYDKDGTSLKVGGRVQAVLYKGGSDGKMAGEKDSTLENSARFNIEGKTKVNSNLKPFAKAEWDMADSSTRAGEKVKSRDMFVGVNFGDFGKLQLGRYKSNQAWVTKTTDVFDDFGCLAQSNDDSRNSGRIDYEFSRSGFDAKIGYVTAVDSFKIVGNDAKTFNGVEFKSVAIDHAFSLATGYTFDNVAFGPLSLRAGYEQIVGQEGDDLKAKSVVKAETGFEDFDKTSAYSLGASWGSDVGFYTGLSFENKKYQFNNDIDDVKTQALEFVVGYGFDFGLSLVAGYNQVKIKDITYFYNKTEKDVEDFTLKYLPVYANYKLNPNFNIWSEARFNLTSDDDLKTSKLKDENTDGTYFSVG